MSEAPGTLDASATRALAAEILQRPEYASARTSDELGWLSQLKTVLVDLLRHLAEFGAWLDALRSSSPALYWLLFAALVFVLVLLVAHISWAISRALRGSSELEPRRGSAPSIDFPGQSRRLAEEGRYVDAAHCLLLASLQCSAHSGLIELHPEDTNRDVRGRLEVARLPGPLRAELLELMRITERAWFRDRVEDPALYARWSAAYGRLVDATD